MMKYKTIILVILIIILFSNFAYAIKKDLPSTVDTKEIKDSIEETGKYCYEQSIIRDQEIQKYIEGKLEDVYSDINHRITLFKFVNSIVTFIVVFLAVYINEWLSFHRKLKIRMINEENLVKNDELSKKQPDSFHILKEKRKNDDNIKEKNITENGFKFVFK